MVIITIQFNSNLLYYILEYDRIDSIQVYFWAQFSSIGYPIQSKHAWLLTSLHLSVNAGNSQLTHLFILLLYSLNDHKWYMSANLYPTEPCPR